MPLAATVRPPRKGPIIRQRISEKSDSGSGCAVTNPAKRSGAAKNTIQRRRDGFTSTSVKFRECSGRGTEWLPEKYPRARGRPDGGEARADLRCHYCRTGPELEPADRTLPAP